MTGSLMFCVLSYTCSQVLYQGLGADNRLVTVNPMWLKSYLPGPDGSVDEGVSQQVDAALQRAVGWSRPAGETARLVRTLTCGVASVR